MSASKYSTVLTIILVVLVVAILVGIGILVYNRVLKPKKDTMDKLEAIEEFDMEIGKADEEIETNPNNNNYVSPEITENNLNPEQGGESGGTGKPTVRKKTTYKGYIMLGYITIPKTRVKEPILDSVSPDALNTAVAVLYPSNPQLNEPGNTVIIGHNYRNGTFFSNNKNLAVGDILKIKDNSGRELTYKIYKKFETSENDTSFYNRDTGGVPEVTLSTCTDDVKARIIIQAKAEQ